MTAVVAYVLSKYRVQVAFESKVAKPALIAVYAALSSAHTVAANGESFVLD